MKRDGITTNVSQTRPSFGAAVIRTTCRGCGGANVATVFADLGIQPPANSYLRCAEASQDERAYPLRAIVCSDCFLVQVDTDVPREELFYDYAYFSSFSESWQKHAKAYAAMAIARFGLDRTSFVVEVASNDGYLLKNFVAASIPCLGIEPSDTVAAAASRIGVPTQVSYLDREVAEAVVARQSKADLVIANNVWAHVPDLVSFTAGLAVLLKPEGILTIEVQHLLPLMEHVEFDTLYHEHYTYFSLLAAERLLAHHGLKVFDVEQVSTHGGSLRYYIVHANRKDVPEGKGLLKVRAEEAASGLDLLETYSTFAAQIPVCRDALRAFLAEARSAGKTVGAYGAAAKGNTLLNYCGIGTKDIALVADRNPHKQGQLLPGSHIPIVAPEVLMDAKPDFVLILPWNLRVEIMSQLAGIREWGGKFVTPVPTVQIWA